MNNGLLTCTRYALPPNYYKYCGPDHNDLLQQHVKAQLTDKGLAQKIRMFEVLFSYLKAIARANNIEDPFDQRVVEAYWLGNNLLENIPKQNVYTELVNGQKLKSKMPQRYWKWVIPKISHGAKLHHSFHVFNIFSRTGRNMIVHTLDTMDNCRIGWGKIINTGENHLTVSSQKLSLESGQLLLKSVPEMKINSFGNNTLPDKGKWVTFHWGWMCDEVSEKQVDQLKKYTIFHLMLANQTI